MARSPAQVAYAARKEAERLALPRIPCECGCGTMIPPVTALWKPARFAHGHNPDGASTRFSAGQPAWNKGRPSPWATATHKGKRLTPEQIAQRTATRLAKTGGTYQTARGWKHTPETIAKITAANRQNARSGPANHAWEGGKSFEPYDERFSRAVKRAVLLRDGYRCQDCGTPIGRRRGHRRANIHHIDFTKSNTELANLVALCVPCHARRHWDKRKGGGVAGG